MTDPTASPPVPFTEPNRPDVLPIIELHRQHDGYVSFHVKRGDQFRDLFSIRADELETVFPSILAELQRDSYYSVNAAYRPGYGKNPAHPNLPRAHRKVSDLRWLTACYSDLDAHDVPDANAAVGRMVGAVISLQDQRVIPPASMIVRSGRGIWLFWILRDEGDPDQPQRAWPDKVEYYARVQRAIGSALAAWGSDAGARDAARVTRVPGSVHTGVGRRVAYWIQFDAEKRAYSYTLPELGSWFGIADRSYHPAERRVLESYSPEVKRRGWKAMHEERLRRFHVLWSKRGGFREGMRNRAAVLYAQLLWKHGLAELEVRDRVGRFGKECTPPLSQDEIADAVRSGRKHYAVRDDTISDWFQITPEESAWCGWAPATGERLPLLAEPKLAERTAHRRAMIRGYVQRAGRVPTLREIADALGRVGVHACVATIRTDLAALGISNPRRPGQRAESQHRLGFDHPAR